jgi:Xaa-Pro aminopeptidase
MRETVARHTPLRHVALDERTWAQTSQALAGLFPDASLRLASDLINPMRAIKDDEELERMRAASALADRVFELVVPKLRAGMSELEITQEVDYQFLLNGAESTSFQTGIYIIGPEESGAWPGESHGGGRQLRPGDSLMFDFGCVLDGYCSDFGRSVVVGEPSAEYRRVHELVLQAQQAGIDAMRPGQSTTAEVNATARRVLEDAGYGEAFTHRLGHGIGLEDHEEPYLVRGNRLALRPGMTVSNEPGIYLPGTLGVRIEDIAAVTPDGHRVFGPQVQSFEHPV